MTEWFFPSNGGGTIRGLADAGLETFNGEKNSSLTREICQNSLDAAANSDKPVIVKFKLVKVPPAEIPGYHDYKIILNACKNYWLGNSGAKIFFDNALNQLEKEVPVLIVSDENTTGLAKPYDENSLVGWNTLTKIDGGANKFGSSGGSFGIGKNAPFAISNLRLVFYRTLNLANERAAQGVSRLASFKRFNYTTTGVGYFGNSNKILPVQKIPALDKISARINFGTDIFIYGFSGGENWQGKILYELLENFLVTIFSGKLIVKFPNYTVDKNYLQKIIPKFDDELKSRKSQARSYYKILDAADSDLKIFEENFHDLGTLRLKVFVDNRADLNRKVLAVRKMGMKIFDLKKFPRQFSFTGIVELQGERLNEFFRQMENPAHNNWEPERHPNSKIAKNFLNEFKKWVRAKISSLSENVTGDEQNVAGLASTLQLTKSQPVVAAAVKKIETLNPAATSKIEIIQTAADPPPAENFKRTRGTITDKKGDSPAVRTLKGNRPRKSKKSHTGVADPEGADIVLAPDENFLECKSRVLKIGQNYYRLILQPHKDISGGHVKIFAVGEDGELEQIKFSADRQSIQIPALQAGQILKIDFSPAEENSYSLRARVYEN